MRLKHVKGSEEAVNNSTFVFHSPEGLKEKLDEQKNRQKTVCLEIGMGKGRFIIENALLYPDVFFIGMEMYESVMVKAIHRLDAMEEPPLNLMLLRADASDIRSFFPDDSVDRIYLNFSDPWPKNRHAKRRLPSGHFLSLFSHVLKPGGIIEFKTDNRSLFDFALEETREEGWILDEFTYDLHSDPDMNKDNIMTEYEAKFSALGNPICKYIIRKAKK